MADVFMYADETGDLDMSGAKGATRWFGFGTAVFVGDHGAELWEGMRLRCHLEAVGIRNPKGLHAKNDSAATRHDMFELIRNQAPRFDATFLLKANAYPSVKNQGQIRLYKMAWYLHFKEIARQVSKPGDTLYVIAATLGTNRRGETARAALDDVCKQMSAQRTIVLCNWDAASSWGVQVADYGLWAIQRNFEGRPSPWYDTCVKPTLRTRFAPWGLTPK